MTDQPILDIQLGELKHPFRGDSLVATIVLLETGFQDTDIPKSHELILEAMQRKTDFVVAPEYSFSSGQGPMSHPQLKNYLSAILEASRKTDALIVPGTFEWLEGRYHHTCYAIKNGNVVFARNKNDKPSSPLDFLGQKVGIQICHENHTPTPFPNGLDLLLVVSAGITIPKLDSVRVGGYALTVDGHNKAYTLMKNAGDGIIVKSNF